MNQEKQHFILQTQSLLFVPYLKVMIPQYHQWMTNPNLLYLTGSEPLTLEEELDNQKSWLNDATKYTFIIVEKNSEDKLDLTKLNEDNILQFGRMIGDINLFFHEYIEQNEAEIDVMIGEEDARKKGYGGQAVQIMMDFGLEQYGKNSYIAKIKKVNEGSIRLFKRLGFKESRYVEAFEEYHLIGEHNKSKVDKVEKYKMEMK